MRAGLLFMKSWLNWQKKGWWVGIPTQPLNIITLYRLPWKSAAPSTVSIKGLNAIIQGFKGPTFHFHLITSFQFLWVKEKPTCIMWLIIEKYLCRFDTNYLYGGIMFFILETFDQELVKDYYWRMECPNISEILSRYLWAEYNKNIKEQNSLMNCCSRLCLMWEWAIDSDLGL